MKIIFTNPLNVSVQEGDIMYASRLNELDSSGINTDGIVQKPPISIGEIIRVDHEDRSIEIDTIGYSEFSKEHYLFFSKNRSVNTSGILGYYASVEYRNYSRKKAEIFATGTEYAPSSK